MTDARQPAEGVDGVARAPASVRERDLDNFLLEELSASPPFRAWFLSRLGHCFDPPAYSRAVVGKNPKRDVSRGQTDLSLVLEDPARGPVALILIESKIASGFQPDQPERYQAEIVSARSKLGERSAAAVVVAPSTNTAVFAHPCFDATISLEDISGHLEQRLKTELRHQQDGTIAELRARLEAKIDLLAALAGKRGYGNWRPNPLPERVGFMDQYRRIATELLPAFKITDSTAGRQATSILFVGPTIPGVPLENIRHDFGETQRVSAVLRGVGHATERLARAGLLPDGAQAECTRAGTLMIRLQAPPLDPTASRFGEQGGAVRSALVLVRQLHDWLAANAIRFGQVVAGPDQ